MPDFTKAQAYLLLFLAAAAWGFQPLCIKYLVAEWSPVTVAFIRYTLMSLLILLCAYHQEGKKILPSRHCLLNLLCMGLTGIALNNALQFTGLKTTTVVNSTLISATTPAMTVILAALLIKDKVSRLGWCGLALSFCGVLLVVSRGSWQVIRNIAFNRGDLYCLGSQLAWAFYSLASLKVMRELSPLAATGWAGLLGAVFLGLYGSGTGEIVPHPLSTLAFLSFVYSLLVGGFMAMVFWNMGVKKTGVSAAAIFLNVMPLVGMLTGYFALGEAIGLVQLGGAAAIIGGVYLTTHSK